MRSSAGARLACVTAVLIAAACSGNPGTADRGAAASPVDSIVLERGPCFGFCPIYRLVLEGDGRITYRAQNATVTQTDSVSPDAVAWLADRAREIGFHALPARIREDSTLCAMMATDHPSAVISIHAGRSVKTVDHYTGCHVDGDPPGPADALVRLTDFAAGIDSVARVSRWTDQPRGSRE